MVRGLRQAGVVIFLLGLAGGWGLSLRAQTISGIITGKVTDPSGAGTSANVTATNQSTGRSYSGPAGEDGNYRIAEVPPGDYNVSADSGGFQTERAENVRVDVNHTTSQDFQLPIAAAEATQVKVIASTAPFTEKSAATLKTDFNSSDIQQLPILSRDVNNLALLAPGVSDVRTFSFGSTLVPFSANGSRGRDNNFIIDSVSNNEPLFGGAAAQFTNTDVFVEYTVLTDQMKAEFGRNSGATINAITKSGSQNTHGTLFWFGQQQNFNALSRAEQQALLTSPPISYENQLGFTLGGPVPKSKEGKLLYFISYQWDGALSNLSSVFPVINTLPTTAGLATLKGLPATPALNALLNTPTVTQVPAANAPCFGSTPSGDPKGQTTNPCFPSVNVPVNSGGGGTQNVNYGAYLVPNGNVFNQHDHQASARLDYKYSNADDVYGRYLFDNLLTPRAPLDPAGEVAFGDLGLLSYWRNIFRQRTQSFLLNERHGWVNALNEFRVSFVRINQASGPLGVTPSLVNGQAAASVFDKFGNFGNFSGNFPSAGDLFTLGSDTRPDQTTSNIVEVQENFSFTRRAHSFKFGADLIHTQSNIRSMPQDLGHYFFGNDRTGGLSPFINEPGCTPQPAVAGTNCNPTLIFQRLPNVLTDGAGNITGHGQDELPLREFDQFFFFQDDWRYRPNLTFNLGLRYENFGQPINGIARFNPAAPHVAQDNNNFAPRFGFAWSPSRFQDTVIRGGYSIMYDPMPLEIPLLIWQSAPISPFVVTSPIGTPGSVFNAAQPSGVFPNLPFTPADLNVQVPGCNPSHPLATTVPLFGCSEQDTVDPRLVNPYVQTWTLGLQHAFSSNFLIEAGFVGNHATKNYQRIDANPFQGWNGPNNPNCLQTLGNNPVCLQDRAKPNRGDIQRITNGGLSNYNALQVSLTKRSSHRYGELAFTAAYTYSHTIDNASEAFSPGSVEILPGRSGNLSGLLTGGSSQQLVDIVTPLPQDSNNLRNERGNSSYDRRHRLAVSYVWELPKSGYGGAAGGLLNGWQFNGIAELQSGQSFSPLNALPSGDNCADANGNGLLTTARPAIGNPSAPAYAVALVKDRNCINTGLGYVDLNGNSIDPKTARFVQVPLGVAAGQPFSVGTESFVAGSAGRNSLVGPALTNLDVAVYKNFSLGESRSLQFRVEIYDVMNHPNPGFPVGNVFAAQAQQTGGYAFSPRSSPAGVSGLIPENTIDAVGSNFSHDFLGTQFMNTSNRRMQFGIRLVF